MDLRRALLKYRTCDGGLDSKEIQLDLRSKIAPDHFLGWGFEI
jgi:hypothetical protein